MAQSAIAPDYAPSLKMTYEEFLDWDHEDEQNYEWVDGEVVEMGTVSADHNLMGIFLIRLFTEFLEIHAVGELRYDPFNMKIGPNLPGRSPDLMFLANENRDRLRSNYLDGPADIVIEIISTGTRYVDEHTKYREYEQGGVREYWLLDPKHQTQKFYGLDANGKYQLLPVSEAGIFRSVVLSELWFKTEWLWQRPAPTMRSVREAWGVA